MTRGNVEGPGARADRRRKEQDRTAREWIRPLVKRSERSLSSLIPLALRKTQKTAVIVTLSSALSRNLREALRRAIRALSFASHAVSAIR